MRLPRIGQSGRARTAKQPVPAHLPQSCLYQLPWLFPISKRMSENADEPSGNSGKGERRASPHRSAGEVLRYFAPDVRFETMFKILM